MVGGTCAHVCDKCYIVYNRGIKTMVTKDDIIIARNIEKKTLKAQAIANTKEYLEGDFSSFLNRTLVQSGKDTAVLTIAKYEKYDTIFFTPGNKTNLMDPPLYDLEYFLQKLRDSGFEVTKDQCYTYPNQYQENIIIKI